MYQFNKLPGLFFDIEGLFKLPTEFHRSRYVDLGVAIADRFLASKVCFKVLKTISTRWQGASFERNHYYLLKIVNYDHIIFIIFNTKTRLI